MPLNKDIKKVLVIGSGPIVIGQAAEFDYAGILVGVPCLPESGRVSRSCLPTPTRRPS